MRRVVSMCAYLRSHCGKAFHAVAPYPVKYCDGNNQPNDSHHISLHNLRAGELSQNQLDGIVNEQLEWQKLGNILNEFWHEGKRHELTREQQDERVIEFMNRIYTRRPEGEGGDRCRKQE